MKSANYYSLKDDIMVLMITLFALSYHNVHKTRLVSNIACKYV